MDLPLSVHLDIAISEGAKPTMPEDIGFAIGI